MVDTSRPKVAIVVRTKDRPDMLRRALASIQAQTFSNWEAIIVNDGGDAAAVDALLTEIDERTRSRVRHLHHQVSLGRWPAANAGVTHTTAPYIVLHDDDDTWHPNFLAATVEHLDTHSDEVGVTARIEVILEESRDGQFVEAHRYLLEAHNPDILLTDLLEFNRFVPIGFLYRRELHDRIGLYDGSLPAAGDWAFNLAAFSLRPIRYVSDVPLAYWHQRPTVDGLLGNSVHAAPADHRSADRRFRDQALRDYVNAFGLGLPLYLSSTTSELSRTLASLAESVGRLERRADHLERQNDLLLHNLSRTIDARLRGWVVRMRQRLSGKR